MYAHTYNTHMHAYLRLCITHAHIHTHADVAVILGLPVKWEATIIAQSDTCSPENTEQQREDINAATLEALRDDLRKLGLLQEESGN